jgi:hypothetical protein
MMDGPINNLIADGPKDSGQCSDIILKLNIEPNSSTNNLLKGEDCLYFTNTYSGHLVTDVSFLNINNIKIG